MESKTTRVRLNLISKEIEFEGSENFIEKYQSTIDEFIEAIKTGSIQAGTSVTPANFDSSNKENGKSKSTLGTLTVPDSFGEFYLQFPRNATVSDKMLIAGFYIQSTSSDTLFSHKEAADLLDEQSVHVSNPGVFIKSLHKTGKLYIQSGKYKVSEKGIEYLKQLLVQPKS